MPNPTPVKPRREPAGKAGAKKVQIARKRAAQAHESILPIPTPGKSSKTLHGAQLMDLRHRACQFPLWGSKAIRDEPDFGKYCGKSIFHRDYCETHFLLCWTASMPSKNATRPVYRR